MEKLSGMWCLIRLKKDKSGKVGEISGKDDNLFGWKTRKLAVKKAEHTMLYVSIYEMTVTKYYAKYRLHKIFPSTP